MSLPPEYVTPITNLLGNISVIQSNVLPNVKPFALQTELNFQIIQLVNQINTILKS